MPRRKSGPAPGSNLRREIAGAAARLMAEEGVSDYGFAKRKAARSLGLGDTDVLPTNDEVETELRAYIALYQSDEQPAQLAELRQDALEAMDLLMDFHPYLTGAVLDGTAGRYAVIELELFADSAKDVEIMLLSHDIPYKVDERAHHRPGAPEAQLLLDWNDTPLRISVYPPLKARISARSSRNDQPPSRADRAAVANLLK